MASRNQDNFTDLEQPLRVSAAAGQPAFSPELHQRILAAIDDCEMLPMQSWNSRLRQPLALAASLLAIVAGGAIVGSSLIGSRDGATLHGPGGNVSSNGSISPPSNAIASHDSDVMQRALAAADHWGWLDEDARSAAAWFVADLPLDFDSPDAALSDDEDDSEMGS